MYARRIALLFTESRLYSFARNDDRSTHLYASTRAGPMHKRAAHTRHDLLYMQLSMLERVRLNLVGREHRGIDDCRNILRICQRLLEDGAVFRPTMSGPGR